MYEGFKSKGTPVQTQNVKLNTNYILQPTNTVSPIPLKYNSQDSCTHREIPVL